MKIKELIKTLLCNMGFGEEPAGKKGRQSQELNPRGTTERSSAARNQAERGILGKNLNCMVPGV